MRATLVLFASVLFISSGASAQAVDDSPALQAAIDVRNQFVEALEQKNFVSFGQKGMDGAIRSLADQIRAEFGDRALADELLSRWQGSSFLTALSAAKAQDLGDHAPLFAWLDQYLAKMAARFGTIIYTLPIVKNLLMLNYAIPVVFHPGGAWRTDAASQGLDLRIEYRKHFIPFAKVVTYYVTFYACQIIAQRQGQSDLKKVCKPAADRLEFAMGRYVAPTVSDWIFRASRQSLEIGPRELKYNTVDELREAIRKEN